MCVLLTVLSRGCAGCPHCQCSLLDWARAEPTAAEPSWPSLFRVLSLCFFCFLSFSLGWMQCFLSGFLPASCSSTSTTVLTPPPTFLSSKKAILPFPFLLVSLSFDFSFFPHLPQALSPVISAVERSAAVEGEVKTGSAASGGEQRVQDEERLEKKGRQERHLERAQVHRSLDGEEKRRVR